VLVTSWGREIVVIVGSGGLVLMHADSGGTALFRDRAGFHDLCSNGFFFPVTSRLADNADKYGFNDGLQYYP